MVRRDAPPSSSPNAATTLAHPRPEPVRSQSCQARTPQGPKALSTNAVQNATLSKSRFTYVLDRVFLGARKRSDTVGEFGSLGEGSGVGWVSCLEVTHVARPAAASPTR